MEARAPAPAATPAAPAPAVRPFSRREAGVAFLACTLLAALFLGGALFTGRRLSPADLLYDYHPWYAVRPEGWQGPQNPLLSDAVLLFDPWLSYTADRLHAGQIPLWNPETMLGAPFAANLQSGVFYPGNWPYWLFPSGATLALLAWLKLVVAGFGTYGLARAVLRAGPIGAATAAVAYTFGAFLTVWLLYPLGSAVIWLPWLWWATAALIARPGPRPAAGLAAAVALDLLAGQPETALHVALVTGAFALFVAVRLRPWRVAAAARRLALWAGAYLLGAAIAAIELVPFVEYLQQGAMFGRRDVATAGFWLPFRFAWTLVAPDLFGNPVARTWWDSASNYNEANSYVGIVVLLLVPLAFVGSDRARRAWAGFLAVIALLAAGAAYHWPGIGDLVGVVPVLRVGANQRFVVVVQLALALLAGLGVEGLLAAGARARRRVLGVLGAGAGVAALGLGIPLLWPHDVFGLPARGSAPATWDAALTRAAVLLAAGLVVALGVVALGRFRPRLAPMAAALLPLLLLGDLWQVHAGYNPTVAPADYFPATPLTTWLQGQPGLFRSTAPGWILMPNANMPYGLSVLGGYDGIMPASYYQLLTAIDPSQQTLTTGGFSPLQEVVSPLLNLLDVRYLLLNGGTDPNYRVGTAQPAHDHVIVGEIRGAQTAGQTFVAQGGNLAAIDVFGATYGHTLTGTLVFHLKTDPAAPDDLATERVDMRRLHDDSFWTFTFPPVAGARGRSFYFYLEAPDARSGQTVTLWYRQGDAYPAGTRVADGQPAPGDLAFHAYSLREPGAAWFGPAPGAPDTGLAVYANLQALPRAWLTHRVQVAPDAAARPAILADPAFDAAGTALLNAPLPAADVLPATPPPTSTDQVSITTYAPEQVTIRTDSPAAGVLVLADQAFPGWEATVDGQAAPIVTADHALRGVYLPAGAHTVVFTYRPGSFVLGAGLSAAGLLVLAGMWAAPRRRRRAGHGIETR